ncbi:MAG: maleylpyruvate isomerase family mycothiol-dependent enzyme [Acidimicrobiales bacterium]
MDPTVYVDAFARDSRVLLDTAHGALDRPVPACPGWDVEDLVVHVGLVWRWAAETVERGERAEREPAPEDRREAALLEWAQEGAARLATVLGAADPDAGCWTFGMPRTARFWMRRQALETALHAWDVGAAAGLPVALDPELASDGIDELLTVMVPRFLAREPGGWAGESIHLHRTDGDGEWLVRLGPDGAADVTRAHGKGDVALRAGAASLWLWSTNRAPVDDLDIDVFGDRELAARWAAEISF